MFSVLAQQSLSAAHSFAGEEIATLDKADTVWVLVSAALVLLMTPALAFFYGGMVRSKNVLNMMMMCLSSTAVVWVIWVLFGYSLAFGNDFAGVIGNPVDFAGLNGLFDTANPVLVGTIPALVFVVFQAGFAMVTVALIAGAIADRMRFSRWIIFAALWITLVYIPVAHWVFAADNLTSAHGGWIINKLKAIDFAGGTAVEINSGAAGLTLAIILGARRGWPKEPMRPHNLPAVMIGAGLLWFGWFGFNAGSSLAVNGTAGLAFANTLGAGAISMGTWLLVERIRDGHATSFGAASGVVAGLVAITPSCASVTPVGALAIGGIAGAVCALAINLKYKFGFDDSLDVVGVHLVGGIVGTVGIGLFASAEANTAVNGLFYGGGVDQLWRQLVAALAVFTYSVVMTAIIAYAMKALIGLRSDPQQEADGLDDAEHAESAYDFSPTRGGGLVKH